jgi:hypothetical protein
MHGHFGPKLFRGLVSSRLVLNLRWPAAIVALTGLLLSGWVHIESLRGIDTEFQWPSVWALHYALFPIIALAVLAAVLASGGKRLSFRAFLALVPVPAWIAMAVVLVYALATFLIFTPLTGMGDPVIVDGRFFFNDHGIMREVTEHQFHLRRSVSLRLYSSFWIYLYLFSLVYLLGARAGHAMR